MTRKERQEHIADMYHSRHECEADNRNHTSGLMSRLSECGADVEEMDYVENLCNQRRWELAEKIVAEAERRNQDPERWDGLS